MLNATQFEPEQLTLFKTAREIKENYRPWPGDRYGDGRTRTGTQTDNAVWQRKSREARRNNYADTGFVDSIATEGVHKPVHLGTGRNAGIVYGGHHRIQVADETDPDRLIPVVHHDGLQDDAMWASRHFGGW